VALEFTDDGGHRVGGERRLPGGVVTVDGLDQSEGGDLVQVVEGFTASAIAGGQRPGQRQSRLDAAGAKRGPVGVAGGQVGALAQQILHRCIAGWAGGENTGGVTDSCDGGIEPVGGDRPPSTADPGGEPAVATACVRPVTILVAAVTVAVIVAVTAANAHRVAVAG
jgi:hypothetical protein